MKNFVPPPKRQSAFSFFLFSFCCLLCSILSIQTVQAQLSGHYTIGGTDGDYETFSEAVADLEAQGISAPVTFKVRSGTYQEQLQINAIPGSSCTNTVTFESEAGENDAVFLTDPSEDFIMQINGVDGIMIRNMNISGTGTLVDIREGADCISMENNILTGATTEEAAGTLVYAESGPSNTGDHHSYIGNTFIGGRSGLLKANISASPGEKFVLDKGLLVMDNKFQGQITGIFFSGQEDYRINRNLIQSDRMHTSGITSTNSFYGKEVSGNVIMLPFGGLGIYFNLGVPERVIGNRVIMTMLGDRHYEATGIGLEAGGMDSQTEMLVANNFIKINYEFSYESNDTYTQGMNISGTAKVYHNSILLSAPGNSTAFYGYGELHVFNNNFSTFWDARIVSTNAVAMDYNNLYSLYGDFNLSDWQSSTGRDLHSISVRPGEELLHPDFEGAGTFLEEVPTDIAGQPRNNPPSIGAIELGVDPDHANRTFTIGGENADYSSFSEAIRNLPLLDGRDSIFFLVRPGVYNEQVKLDTSYYSHVVFEGESRDSTAVVLEYPDDYAVRIHNAKRYTFRYMTISGKGAVHIEAENNGSSEYLTFDNNILRSNGNTAAVYTYTQSVEQYRRNSVSHLSLKNNFITGEGWGILKEGRVGRHQNGGPVFIADKGLEIIGNDIQTGLSGIKVGPTVGAKINFNTLEVGGQTGSSSREGISLTTVTDLLEVKGNQVVVKGPEAKGIIIAHYFLNSDDLSLPRKVINNRIILPDGGTGLWFNIDLNPHTLLVANNMIAINGGDGSAGIQLSELTSSSKFYFNSVLIYGEDPQSKALGFYNSSPEIAFANNIFANTAGGFAIHGSNNNLTETGLIGSSDYNDLYTNGSFLGHWYGTDVGNMSEWQTLTGLDANSFSVDPTFGSVENLIPANPALHGAGTALAEVQEDFFGEQRNDPPTIGAVEEVQTNQPPIVNAGSDKTLTLPNNSISLNGTARDPDGRFVAFLWEKVSGPSVTMSNARTANVNLSDLQEGVYLFRFSATDNDGATGSAEMTLTVNPGEQTNQSPVVSAGPDKTLTLPNNSISLSGTGRDPDGRFTAFLWEKVSGPSVTMSNANSANVNLSELVEGVYVFRFSATDNEGATGSDEMTLTVEAGEQVNQPPVVSAGPDKMLTLPNNSITLSGTGRDPDGRFVAFLWEKVSGPSVTMSNARTANVNLSDLQEGVYVFRFSGTDNEGATASEEMTLTVNAEPAMAIQSNSISVAAYPNTFQHHVNVAVKAAQPEEYQVEVYDMLGKVYYRGSFAGGSLPEQAYSIDLSDMNMEEGTYLIRIENRSRSFQEILKIVKAH